MRRRRATIGPAGLDDGPRSVLAEGAAAAGRSMTAPYASSGGQVALEPRREAAAEVEQPRGEPVGAQRGSNTVAAAAIGLRQAFGSRCWEPTWKVTPAASRPSCGGEPEDVHGLADRTAVLAGQRPVGAVAGGDQAAQDRRAGRGLGDLADLRRRVHDEQADTEARPTRDVVAPLDRVGVDEVVGRRAGGEAGAHLGRAGDVEVAAAADDRGEHLRVRVGLDRVVDRDAGQRRRQLAQAVGDDRGLDLQEGCGGKGHHGGLRRSPRGWSWRRPRRRAR